MTDNPDPPGAATPRSPDTPHPVIPPFPVPACHGRRNHDRASLRRGSIHHGRVCPSQDCCRRVRCSLHGRDPRLAGPRRRHDHFSATRTRAFGPILASGGRRWRRACRAGGGSAGPIRCGWWGNRYPSGSAPSAGTLPRTGVGPPRRGRGIDAPSASWWPPYVDDGWRSPVRLRARVPWTMSDRQEGVTGRKWPRGGHGRRTDRRV